MNEALQKLQEAMRLLTDVPVCGNLKIGIGITTRNRYDTFKKSFAEVSRLSPGCKIVVVDDASTNPVPEATYRFKNNVGIAQAKNKCFELLDDCDHIFLIDDDTYPIVEDWYKPYIESGHAHLMYIFKDFATGRKLNDSVLLYQDSKIKAWSHARGCMLYYHRSCLERVGGMNPVFGTWGWEHVNLSERIYYSGLTQFKYADVINSNKLFYSADEHEAVKSTVVGEARSQQIATNQKIYDSLRGGSEYIPYKQRRNILLTSYFTGVPDPQRKGNWKSNINDILPLYNSLKSEQLVLLHDCFDIDTVELPNVELVKVDTSINPYFQRWISYREYLIANRRDIDKVFCIDATDIELLKDPFPHMDANKIYTGDEVEILGCEWMLNHHKHPILSQWIKDNKYLQLLNAGIVGASVDLLIEFTNKVIDFYFTAKTDAFLSNGRPDAGDPDMGTFNYVARTMFSDKIVHGAMVNTRFKANEKTHPLAWFKHK